MKKFTFLLMFLLLSNTSFSQTTSTNPTKKCFSDAQIGEMFRGLKQNDYLKMRLEKTESALETADKLINEQSATISTHAESSKLKDKIIAGEIAKCDEEKKILNAQIGILTNDIQEIKIDAKNSKRKAFWNGIKIGGISVGILGAAAILILK